MRSYLYLERKNVPSPAGPDEWKNFIIFTLLAGTPAGVEVAKVYRDQLKTRVEQGIPGMPDERHRLLWVQNRVQFKTDLLEVLERDYYANVVIDELNYVYWDEMEPSNPLWSLAKRQIMHPLAGTAERRINFLLKMAREFHVDGVINPAHWGCRQSGGARSLFKDAFQEVGIPILHLDVDCVDERNYSKAQVLTRLEAFMELLAQP
nr:2-hydroxyacyl-CoA dehydratase family protein [Candidatus Sigynarchaeota archaeon]